MTEMTNFDKIREDILALLEMKDIPELAKEILLKAIADENSLSVMLNTVAIAAYMSKPFAAGLETAMAAIESKMMLRKLANLLGINVLGTDEDNCNCPECKERRAE